MCLKFQNALRQFATQCWDKCEDALKDVAMVRWSDKNGLQSITTETAATFFAGTKSGKTSKSESGQFYHWDTNSILHCSSVFLRLSKDMKQKHFEKTGAHVDVLLEVLRLKTLAVIATFATQNDCALSFTIVNARIATALYHFQPKPTMYNLTLPEFVTYVLRLYLPGTQQAANLGSGDEDEAANTSVHAPWILPVSMSVEEFLIRRGADPTTSTTMRLELGPWMQPESMVRSAMVT